MIRCRFYFVKCEYLTLAVYDPCRLTLAVYFVKCEDLTLAVLQNV